MHLVTITGEEYEIHPVQKYHVYVDIDPPLMSTKSGIIVPESGDYPRTIGVVLDLPDDDSYIQKCFVGGLKIGDTFIFSRYATEKVVTRVVWEEIETVDWAATYTGLTVEEATKKQEIFTIREVHVMHVDDIECLIT
jgi:co-chaperonin GroES (HSP10)